jgi:uncharacterized protein YcnI
VRLRVQVGAVALVAALLAAPIAAAHVTLNPREWEAEGFARFALRVPNERDNAATTRITVRFPEQVLSASFQPVEGWRRTVKMARLDEPIDDEGEQITERIDTVTWSGGRIEPGEFTDFGLSLRMPEGDAGDKLTFKALQTYEDGEVVRWIGPENADEPAPIITLTAADAGDGQGAPGSAGTDPDEPVSSDDAAAAQEPATTGASASAPAEASSDDGGGDDGLAIAALVVAALALGAAVFAALRPRARA